MNIAFFTHCETLYGANRSLIDLAMELSRKGWGVFLVAPTEGAVTDCFRAKDFPVVLHSFPWFFTVGPQTEAEIVERLDRTMQAVQSLAVQLKAWKIDCVYSNSSVIDIGLLAARAIKKPHVWHIREYGALDYNVRPDVGAELFRRLLCCSDGLVFISQALKEYALPQCTHPAMHVVYNGIATTAYLDTVCANSKKMTKKGIDTFCIVGAMNTKKGQDVAVRALAKIIRVYSHIKLLIVGGGEMEWLRGLIADLQLQNNVFLLGEVPEPMGIFLNADVALMCSQNEAMGRVTVEAMACACPVIGYNGGATPEIITHGQNGLLYKGGEDALAACMLQMIEAPIATRMMGEYAQRMARDRFTVETYANEIMKIVQSIVSGGNLRSKRPVLCTENSKAYAQDRNEPYWSFYKRIVDLDEVLVKQNESKRTASSVASNRHASALSKVPSEKKVTIDALPLNAKIVIYGTGTAGQHFYRCIASQRRDITVVGFADSFSDGELFGLPVKKGTQLSGSCDRDLITCIASSKSDEIIRELRTGGIDTYLVMCGD